MGPALIWAQEEMIEGAGAGNSLSLSQLSLSSLASCPQLPHLSLVVLFPSFFSFSALHSHDPRPRLRLLKKKDRNAFCKSLLESLS